MHRRDGNPPFPYATRALPCSWLLTATPLKIGEHFPPTNGARGASISPCLSDQQGRVKSPEIALRSRLLPLPANRRGGTESTQRSCLTIPLPTQGARAKGGRAKVAPHHRTLPSRVPGDIVPSVVGRTKATTTPPLVPPTLGCPIGLTPGGCPMGLTTPMKEKKKKEYFFFNR